MSRPTRFPCRIMASFSKEQMSKLEDEARKQDRSIAWVIREIIFQEIPSSSNVAEPIGVKNE